jgi:nicotinate-nucleotide pyrophosphorylase (carboxylating)
VRDVLAKAARIIRYAIQEDRCRKDITTQRLIAPDLRVKARLVYHQRAVVCGLGVVRAVYAELDRRVKFMTLVKEGQEVGPGQTVAILRGPARAILSGERVALNFLQRLSGIATLTRRFVNKIKGYKAKIYDTRKTTPGLRVLEKYAVKVGGGQNHRMDLASAMLVKDNHLRIVKDLQRLPRGGAFVEIEVQDPNQLERWTRLGVDIIMLDNMSVAEVAQAIQQIRKVTKGIEVEVSGNINLRNVARYAALGVDRISVGALTHSAPSIDISIELQNVQERA